MQLQPDHPSLAQPDRFPVGAPLPEIPMRALISIDGKPFDAETNPVRVGWLPDFANRWFNKKLARAEENVPRVAQDPEYFVTRLIGSVPSALFVLVPVFALLLKLAYIETRRVYLEHLVVALYSHAYLCLCILVFCLVQAVGGLIPSGNFWLKIPQWTVQMALLAWMPVYLFWMQQRVYRQHVIVTLLKFSVLGTLYFMMLVMAIVFLALTTWVNGFSNASRCRLKRMWCSPLMLWILERVLNQKLVVMVSPMIGKAPSRLVMASSAATPMAQRGSLLIGQFMDSLRFGLWSISCNVAAS